MSEADAMNGTEVGEAGMWGTCVHTGERRLAHRGHKDPWILVPVEGVLSIYYIALSLFMFKQIMTIGSKKAVENKKKTGKKIVAGSLKAHAIYCVCVAGWGSAGILVKNFLYRSHLVCSYDNLSEVSFVGMSMMGETFIMCMITLYWLELAEDNGMKKKDNVKRHRKKLHYTMACNGLCYSMGVSCYILSLFVYGFEGTLFGSTSPLFLIGTVLIMMSCIFIQMSVMCGSIIAARNFARLLTGISTDKKNAAKDANIMKMLQRVNRVLCLTISVYSLTYLVLYLRVMKGWMGTILMGTKGLFLIAVCDLLHIGKDEGKGGPSAKKAKDKKKDTEVSEGGKFDGGAEDSDSSSKGTSD